MSFWLNNPYILLDKREEFYPIKNMTIIDKANALARLGIYYGILIIILQLDSKWLTISFILIFLSIFLGKTEGFDSDKKKCIKPTINNPYMNFTLGDLISNPKRPGACEINNDIREQQINLFKTDLTTGKQIVDYNDLYGTNFNDREFYTMPSTTIVNDQNGFANFLFGDFGKCKSEGKDCLKHRDNRFHRGRYYYQY
jgi:hypothetical protein